MNDKFNEQKDTLVSLKHEISLLQQQVDYLIRNEKSLGLLDLDVMNRAGFGQEGFLGTDMSFISKFIWSVGNWNICSKAGYEFNNVRNVDSNGRAYDLVIAPGTEYFYAGAGLEWFPLSKDNLRLHAVYYRDNSARKNNLEIGVTWRADIIKK